MLSETYQYDLPKTLRILKIDNLDKPNNDKRLKNEISPGLPF